MAGFESSLGKTSIGVPKRKVLTIPDESNGYGINNAVDLDKNSVIEGLKHIREDKLAPNRKKRLEVLLGIGKIYREVVIDSITFTLQTLKSKEIQELAKFQQIITTENVVDAMFEIRKHILAYSLCAVDGISIGEYLGNQEELDIDDKLCFIENLSESIVVILHDEYQKLVESSNLKYGIKTKEEVQEVIEDVKK